MDIGLAILFGLTGLLNLVGGFFLGTWYCKNIKGTK